MHAILSTYISLFSQPHDLIYSAPVGQLEARYLVGATGVDLVYEFRVVISGKSNPLPFVTTSASSLRSATNGVLQLLSGEDLICTKLHCF
ncbi:hypothetical protein [Chitinophaga sp. OAE865]|uniref:hypothetical protein n=1 Tax=Chitinophaga sp. OAE865 TaxID=2817898 RepID=UPI001AE2DDBC